MSDFYLSALDEITQGNSYLDIPDNFTTSPTHSIESSKKRKFASVSSDSSSIYPLLNNFSDVESASTNSEEDERACCEKKLHILDIMFDSFNVYDVDTLFSNIFEICDDNLIICSKHDTNVYIGKGLLFALWHLAHDVYPDAMSKILDRRLISLITPKHDSFSQEINSKYEVECVYKFAGTKVCALSLLEVFDQFTKRFSNVKDWHHQSCAEISDNILTFVSEGGLSPSSRCETGEPCFFIFSATMSLHPVTHKITKWTIENLAKS